MNEIKITYMQNIENGGQSQRVKMDAYGVLVKESTHYVTLQPVIIENHECGRNPYMELNIPKNEIIRMERLEKKRHIK